MSIVRTAMIATAALFTASAAHADWSGQGEAGFVMARGNSDTDSANAKLDLSTQIDRWKHAALLNALYGKNNDIKSAQRLEGRWQTDFSLNDRLFTFGNLRYEQDRFSGFNYQAILAAGLGYHFIATDDTKLTTTLGAGYRKLRPETLVKDTAGNVIDRIEGEESDDGVLNAGLDFMHKLTPNTTITNKLLIESGSDNTFGQNDLALQVSMTDKLALSVGYSVRRNTDPPAGLKKTDQLTTLNLVYKINK